MDESERGVILRRRALFVGSALAALGGCAQNNPPAEHAANGPVVVTPAAPDADDSEPGVPIDSDAGTKRPRNRADMPSLEIPAGVSETARQNYEQLASTFGGAYRLLDEIEAGLPSCAITDASCESRWRAIAEKQYELENAFRFFHICPGKSEEAKTFRERELAHRAYYEEQRKDVQARLDAALGAAGKPVFDRMLMDIRTAKPVPCLSFACPDW